MALDADGLQAGGGLGGGGFPGFVRIEGKPNAFDFRGTDGFEDFGGEVGGAEGAGDVFYAVMDEGQGVEDAFGEDDFAGFYKWGLTRMALT